MSCPSDSDLEALLRKPRASGPRRALEQHMGDCASCRSRADMLSPTVAPNEATPGELDAVVHDDTLPAPEGGPPALGAGETVGRYRVHRVLGSGGMGVVYEALDTSLNRRVALKVMQPALLGDPRATQRLFREAQAMARVSDRHVITVHDVGIDDDQVFIAMELVRGGGTLRDWCEHAPRSTAEIIRKFIDAGEALVAAHDKGVVHRDFKPDNVLVDDKGEVLVTDFGLATEGEVSDPPPSSVGGGDLLATPLTQTGAAIGTPAYMAPEQHHGERADARADQFSFCVALYEALFGELPFAGTTRRELVENMKANSVRSTGDERSVPRAAMDAIVTGLRFAPDERHSTLEPLLRALRDAEEHLHKPETRRGPVVAAVAAFAAIAFTVVTAARLTTSRRTPLAEGSSTPLVAAELTPSGTVSTLDAPHTSAPPHPGPRPAGSAADAEPSATEAAARGKGPQLQDGYCSTYCPGQGRCKKVGSGAPSRACGAVSEADCKRSSGCAEFGRCLLDTATHRCVASAQTCQASYVCTAFGRCTLEGGSCVLGSTSECASAGRCKAFGRCTFDSSQKRCIAKTAADCRRATTCTERGNCVVTNGACAPGGSDAACAKSSGCNKFGHCHWSGTRCVAKTLADCRRVNPDKDWVVDGGECKNAP